MPSRLLNSPLSPVESGEFMQLTERQMEVLYLMAQGKTDRQIAENLIISFYTAKEHVQNLFRILGVSNRAACVAVAVRQGILPGENRRGLTKRY